VAYTEAVSSTIKGKNRAGGMAEVVECLPSICKTMNSNPTAAKKKKKERKKEKNPII
jgi:hypothetical protein